MSRDEACGPHFSFAKFQISIFSSRKLSQIVLTGASYFICGSQGAPDQ